MRKIVFFVSSMHAGGAERVAATLANAWVDRGMEVVLVPTFSGRGSCFYELSPNVSLRYLADEAKCTGKGVAKSIRRFIAARRLVRDLRPDVVVSFLTNVNVVTLIACRGLNVPIVACEHNYPPMCKTSVVLEVLRRITYPSAAMVTMLTSEGLTWLKEHIPRARGVVMPNPVGYPLVPKEPKVNVYSVVGGDRCVLLAVGRLVSQKGFDYLLDAFAGLKDRFDEWDLVVLGEGGSRGELQERARSLGLEGRVYFPGAVGNVCDWYARANIFVMSSRFEGFPMTLAEAMAYGCPVVSYDCDTGPRDLIEHGVNGVLVGPVGDVGALQTSLAGLMEDPARRVALGEKAKKVRERYSVGRLLDEWERLFRGVS